MMDDRTRLLAELRVRAGELGLVRFAAARGDWAQTKGPRGGTVWVHSGTGAKRYQKNKPAATRVARDHPAAVKPGAKQRAFRTRQGAARTAQAPAPAKPAPQPAPAKAAPTHRAAPLLEKIAQEGTVDLADLRGAIKDALPGASFDQAVLAMEDAGLIILSRDFSGDNPAVANKPYVKEGDYTFTSAAATNALTEAAREGKLGELMAKALGGKAAAARPAVPKAPAKLKAAIRKPAARK